MAYTPKTVTIYSVGLIGGSIGAALKAGGFGGRIVGLSSEGGLKVALERGFIDEGHPYSDLSTVVSQTDLLILCSPILAIISTIKELGGLALPQGLVITDIGSTKRVIIDAAKEYLPPHVQFIGGHPMAGSEKSGPGASDAGLFRDAVYVLTPIDGGDGYDVNKRDINTYDVDKYDINTLADFLRNFLGCRTMILDASVHDTAVAAVSHLPHIIASALMQCAIDREKLLPGTLSLAAGGFRDMTRIAASKYEIWHDIFVTNKEAIMPLIDSYIDILVDMKGLLGDDGLKESFEEARRVRESMG